MSERLPIFPLRTVPFPGDLLPLHVFEPRYRLMISRCVEREPCFGVVLTRSGREVGEQPAIYGTGTSAIIAEQVSLPDGRSNLLVRGARRFQILASDWDASYLTATIEWCDPLAPSVEKAVLEDALGRIQDLLAVYLRAYNQATGQQVRFRDFGDEPVTFAYGVASTLPMPLETRQQLLEATPPDQLLALLESTVRHETALLVRTGAYAFLPGYPGTRFSSN